MKLANKGLLKPKIAGLQDQQNTKDGVQTKMAELLVVRSKIKESTKLNVAGDFADALSDQVAKLIKEAERRAEANGRKTLKRQDL